MRLFQFTLLLVCSFSNAQTYDSNLKFRLVYLETDSIDKIEIIGKIESFYKLTIEQDLSITRSEGNSFEVSQFVKAVQDTLSSESDYFYLFFTNKPIYIGQKDFTLRGFASKRTAIVSTFKIKSQSKTAAEYERILLKTFLHETGHLLGLMHCTNSEKCFMVTSFPESLFLNSQNLLCDSCINIIKIHIR